jgi:hypothetical protein
LSQHVTAGEADQRPEQVQLEFAYGPAAAPQRFLTEGAFRWDAVRQGAKELLDAVHQTGQLPSVVWIAGQPLRPEDFAVTLASVVAAGHYPAQVPLRQGELEAKKFVADDSPRLWGWVIFPPGFTAPHMMEIAKLQAWTIKPAVLRKLD